LLTVRARADVVDHAGHTAQKDKPVTSLGRASLAHCAEHISKIEAIDNRLRHSSKRTIHDTSHFACGRSVVSTVDTFERLLYSRRDAARLLSISTRSLDYLIGTKQLTARRLGRRLLVPRTELLRFVRADHPDAIRPA
jgi:hypothetical protein